MSEIEEVKRNLNIRSLAESYGASFKGAGKFADPAPCCGNNGCCSIDESKNVFHCFSCGKEGSSLDLIMAAENIDFIEALKKGAEIAGVTLTSTPEAAKKAQESIQERLYRLAAEYYHQLILQPGCEGYKWFIKARAHKPETLKKMRLGWVGRRAVKTP